MSFGRLVGDAREDVDGVVDADTEGDGQGDEVEEIELHVQERPSASHPDPTYAE